MPTLSLHLQHRRPDHPASPTAATRATSRSKAESVPEVDRHRRHRRTSGPEPEFFIFDDVRFDAEHEPALLLRRLDRRPLEHAAARSGRNLGYKPGYKEGYFPVPADRHRSSDLRTEMVPTHGERRHPASRRQHHEVATAGQCEIDMRFDALVDDGRQPACGYKYVVKNVARRNGKTVTFMPKPLFGDNGSGMHCHQSLWKDGKTALRRRRATRGLSKMALYYIGGILKHAKALLRLHQPDDQLATSAWCRATRRR
ncbi:MAG: hypothetical protein MZW92_22385 [Comamonadaceae bacterium]|nr:hypothetical protein [Comamonadaceae bacterium]